MNYTIYNLTPEEIEHIKSVNAGSKKYRCLCGIQETKPSFCAQGPMLGTLMPECGFKFERDEKGEIVRTGACSRCGRCCQQHRRLGSPYGFFDVGPEGKPCEFLKVEET